MKTILFQCGPLHLFFTTAKYLILSAMKHGAVVLLVTDSYKSNKEFLLFSEEFQLRRIYYVGNANTFKNHVRMSETYDRALNECSPSAAYLHCEYFVDNLYLRSAISSFNPNMELYFYQSGRQALFVDLDTEGRLALAAANLVYKLPKFLQSTWVLRRVFHLLKFKTNCAFLVNTKLYPALVRRELFFPKVKYGNGTIIISNFDKDFPNLKNTVHLQYTEQEALIVARNGAKRIKVIPHPKWGGSTGGVTAFGRSGALERPILIAPSIGFIEVLWLRGQELRFVYDNVFGVWCNIIVLLRKFFPGVRLLLKLHPSISKDSMLFDIFDHIVDQYKFVSVIPAGDGIEDYLQDAFMVIGDVSSVLWSASFSRQISVISLDMFGFVGGDELNGFENISSARTIADFVKLIEPISMQSEVTCPSVRLTEPCIN